MGKVTYTQEGQQHPYGDSIYAGTIAAETKEEARELLEESRDEHQRLLDKRGQGEDWWKTFLDRLEPDGPGQFAFRFISPSTS